jgi:putative transposase
VSKPQLIRQGYRFALAPTAEQEVFLCSCAGASRFWFNQGLALVRDRMDQRRAGHDVRVPWSYKRLCSELAALKDDLCPWRGDVVVGSMQAGLEQLGRALQNHSEGKARGVALASHGFEPRVVVTSRSSSSARASLTAAT